MKGFLKSTIAIIVILAAAFGMIYYFNGEADKDDSYKVKTIRNPKYNGVYTLTKIDENGKNTWTGLIMYVKNDKLISGGYVETQSYDEIIETQLDGNKNATEDEIIDACKLSSGVSLSQSNDTGFGVLGAGRTWFSNYVGVTKGMFVFYKKDVDFKKDYPTLKACKIVAGYDEDSKEIWLSKLLKNKNSEFYKGYKLIHYKEYNDLEKNCALDSGECIESLNRRFKAGLKDWYE